MTPSHDGSRTPGQSGAWDPTVTNTPARTNDFDGYNIEEAGSPGYGPGYPPTGGPFTPQTPGTMYGSEQSFSSYQPSPSPAGSATASPSPAGYVATPSPNGTGYTTSPHGAFATPSPMAYSPMTPGKTQYICYLILPRCHECPVSLNNTFCVRCRSRWKSVQSTNSWSMFRYWSYIWNH